jgi:hypothetical protein
MKKSIQVLVVACALIASNASAQVAKPVTCSFESTNLGNGKTKLVWGSANAIFASIDNNIGTVSADGEMTVNTLSLGAYTLHVWNSQGTGSYCTAKPTNGTVVTSGSTGSAQGGVVSTPVVTVTTTQVTGNPNIIALNTVPHTGAEDYISLAVFAALALSGAYSATQSKRLLA